jgi:hypothetical protein
MRLLPGSRRKLRHRVPVARKRRARAPARPPQVPAPAPGAVPILAGSHRSQVKVAPPATGRAFAPAPAA